MRIRDIQKEQIRATLLKVGAELIEKHGLDGTTIEAITAKAGVAKGTFYNYFKTKHDLVYSAVHEGIQGWEDELERILHTFPTTPQRLSEVFRRIIARVEQHPELNWIYLMERLQRVAAASPFSEIMRRIFAAGQAAGEIRTDRPPEAFAHDLSGLFLVHVARAYHTGKLEILYKTLPGALEIYLHGAVVLTPAKGDKTST